MAGLSNASATGAPSSPPGPTGPAPAEALRRLVQRLERHGKLSAADRAAIMRLPHSVKRLDRGAYLIREGDRPERCCLLLSGFAYRHKLVGEGARQIVSIHMPGDPIDLQNIFLALSDHNVQMLTPATVATIRCEAVAKLVAAFPAVARAMWADTLIDASIHREWVANVGRRDARTRVAHVLCELALRQRGAGLAKDGTYFLPLTQEQLADATGLTAVHVNRVLKGLSAEQLIMRGNGRYSVPDWERLAGEADFNPAYLHPTQNEIG